MKCFSLKILIPNTNGSAFFSINTVAKLRNCVMNGLMATQEPQGLELQMRKKLVFCRAKWRPLL